MASPRPKKKLTKDRFNFAEAMLHVIAGRKITKMEWANPAEYVMLTQGFLCIHHSGDEDDKFHRLLVSEGDLMGEDWQVIVEEDYEKN